MLTKYQRLQKTTKDNRDVLIHYAGYPRCDFILGYMFFQVSINDFVKHNTGYTNIDLSFNQRDSNGKNQIENYLDGAFGGIHKAKINETTVYFTEIRQIAAMPNRCRIDVVSTS